MNGLKNDALKWKLNTSNLGKFEEFKALFARRGFQLEASHVDLKEIEADHLMVVQHKASQMEEGVIVDDTSLEIEGMEIGVNVRWLLHNLPQLKGLKAVWVVLLAYRLKEEIHIFKGEIKGTIVTACGGSGFGFDPYFLPNGAQATLAESKSDQFNARAIAVDALLEGNAIVLMPVMKNWEGSWQDG